jgi:leucyl/phenylalanyl-tRNA--protein transferase
MDEDLRAVSADLDVGEGGLETILSAYRAGLFPMGLGDGGGAPIGWWAPALRGVLLPGSLRISRSLRRSLRRYTHSIDRDFAGVVDGCADPDREGAWISPRMREVYLRLHAAGWARSIEVWDADGGLAGGLFGIDLGHLFIGESMFHRSTDASKVAVVRLAEMLTERCGEDWTVDVQWSTPHLESLGVSELSGLDYLVRLRQAEARDGSELFYR